MDNNAACHEADGKTPNQGVEGRDNCEMDIDRMVNEGLGGGQVTLHNGLVGDSTVDAILKEEGGLL